MPRFTCGAVLKGGGAPMDNANSAQRDSEIVGLVNLPVRLLYMGKLFNDATLLGKLEAAP